MREARQYGLYRNDDAGTMRPRENEIDSGAHYMIAIISGADLGAALRASLQQNITASM